MLWGNQSLRELWAVIHHNFCSSSISEKQGEETDNHAKADTIKVQKSRPGTLIKLSVLKVCVCASV